MAKLKGLPLQSVVDTLNAFADPKLAESWDNVGLLIEPPTPRSISTILLTNDLTETVMDEVEERRANLIISYHPPIFAALKKITKATWKERIVGRCLEGGIALYSPHTAWDAVHGGVTDWLTRAFDGMFSSCTPIAPLPDSEKNGGGRIICLDAPVPLTKCVDLIKKHTGLPHVRLAQATSHKSEVTKVAFVCGSGASLLRGVACDLYVTGEMLHHEILEANHNGASVILTNHSDSERGFLKVMASNLQASLKDLSIIVSENDRDPLTTV